MKVFIIPGYGIPDNILEDKKYLVYLNSVYKYISSYSREHPRTKITIIFSGGNSDLEKPYTRTEAQEMARLFEKISAKNDKKWKIRLEKKSLSSLENQVYPKSIIDGFKKVNKKVIMFCEPSRVGRLRKIGKLVFGKIEIVGISIPMSKEQSKDKNLIEKKENLITNYSIWALKSRDNFKKFRKTFQRKFQYLRKFPKKRHEEAIIMWWKKSMAEAAKNQQKH